MTYERMVVPIEWKADANDGNVLTGYASTFGNVDRGGDVVMPGAFTKTIGRIKSEGIPLLADHIASTASVLGTIFDAKEDTKGLQIKARVSQAPSAQDTAIKLREGHLSKLSIGYETMEDAYEDRDGLKVRLLKEVKLWETSVVVFPMNPEAVIAGMKHVVTRAHEAGISTKQIAEFAVEAKDAVASKVAVWVDEDELARLEQKAVPMSTLDAERHILAVEAMFGLGSDSPAPGEPGTTPEESKDAVPDEGSAQAGTNPTADAADEAGAKPDEGSTGGPKWDRWQSDALLAGRSTGAVDAATRAALQTRLQLVEGQLSSGAD